MVDDPFAEDASFDDGLDDFDTPVAVSSVYPSLAQVATLKVVKGRPVYGRLCLFRVVSIERVPKMDKPSEMTDRATVDIVLLDGEDITEKEIRDEDPVPLDSPIIVGESIIEGMWVNGTLLCKFFRRSVNRDGVGNGRWILGRIHKLPPNVKGNAGAWDLGDRAKGVPPFSDADANLARRFLTENRDRL